MKNILNHKIMGLIREPLDVDFYVDPRPLTKEEREKISQHIREYKLKMAEPKNRMVLSERKGLRTSK
ncbi:MAG: hypothetical protein ABIN97_04630 [Ginsengibacter sp.]